MFHNLIMMPFAERWITQIQVINGKQKYKINKEQLYIDAIMRLIPKTDEADMDVERDLLKKFLFLIVKRESERRTSKEFDCRDVEKRFQYLADVTTLLSLLTPVEFMQMFPVTKEYDSEKYQVKDYFTVMEKIRELPSGEPIGQERIMEFLWDYQNRDITNFELEKMMTLSNLRKCMGEKGLMEEFLEEQGVPTYNYHKEEGYLYKTMTGEVTKVMKHKSRIPKYLKIIDKN